MSLKVLFEEYDAINKERIEAAAHLAEIDKRRSDKVAEIAKLVAPKKQVMKDGLVVSIVARPSRNGSKVSWFFRGASLDKVFKEDD